MGKTVLVETSGSLDIGLCDPRVIKIMDLKSPGSGMCDRNDWNNIPKLSAKDEVKFVLCDRDDYLWAKDIVGQYELNHKVKSVLFSAVGEMSAGKEVPGVAGLSMQDLAAWILEDDLPVTMQVQLHKIIWDPSMRGV